MGMISPFQPSFQWRPDVRSLSIDPEYWWLVEITTKSLITNNHYISLLIHIIPSNLAFACWCSSFTNTPSDCGTTWLTWMFGAPGFSKLPRLPPWRNGSKMNSTLKSNVKPRQSQWLIATGHWSIMTIMVDSLNLNGYTCYNWLYYNVW